MKFKKLIIFVLLSISINSLSQNNIKIENSQSVTIDSFKIEISTVKNLVNRQNEQIIELEKKLQYQTDQINSQAGMLDTAFDGVSAEISASSNYIGLFGIVITLISIGIGWYVTRIEKSIESMNKDSEQLTERNISIKQSVEALSEKITNDSKGLYNIIRNEESNHLLDRLIFVPEDIDNLFFSIAARDLEPDHYSKLKEAYIQVIDDPNFNVNYSTLMLQHFSSFWPFDTDVKDNVIANFDKTFSHSYKNDILKSSKDFFAQMSKVDLDNYKEEINAFINAFCKTTFCNDDSVYSVIDQALESKNSKFKLYNLIDKIEQTLTFRKKIGSLIIEYNFDDLSNNEKTIIEEIKNL